MWKLIKDACILTGVNQLASMQSSELETGWETYKERNTVHKLLPLHKMVHENTSQYFSDPLPL